MTIRRYETAVPRTLADQMQRELERWFERNEGDDNGCVSTCDWVPAVDVKEETERFVIHADLPGVDPAAIDITLEKGILTIKGERPALAPAEAKSYRRVERPAGTFYRRFTLPESADAGHIEASCRNGVLEVNIPKREKEKARRIAVTH